MQNITVQNTINSNVEKVWEMWTGVEHIMNWCHASDDWHCPQAISDLRVGGKFVTTMAAKDGSFSFELPGVYDEVIENAKISYTMTGGRQVEVIFVENDDNSTQIIETFDSEDENPIEMQRSGWQSILDNFKKYVENN